METVLYEKYRPKDFEHVLGQDKAISQIKRLLVQGWGGRAWWIAGASGTGKTTLARIIAGVGADNYYITEIDSADLLTSAKLDEISETMHYYGGLGDGKSGRAWIINEAHGLRRAAIRRLLGLLEPIPQHVCFIFTTTKVAEANLFEDHEDAGPLLSRCHRIELTNQGLSKVFAEHCRQIATTENLNGKPMQSYIKLAANYKNNCQMMLQSIELGQMLAV